MASDTHIEMSDSDVKNVFTGEKNSEAYVMHRIDTTSNSEQINNPINKNKDSKKKITIIVDEDDPCFKEEKQKKQVAFHFFGADPRFQQQNQTLRCWVMYTDFYRCERILGTGSNACTWFKQVFTSICPKIWIEQWDNFRAKGKFSWHKYKTQGKFPGDKYGI